MLNEAFGGILAGGRGGVLSVLLRTDTPLTGRQIHRLLADDYSLWTVQEALKQLALLGLIFTETIGRAGVHRINNRHYAVQPLRMLLNPMAALEETVRDAVGDGVVAVLVFGSVARGESELTSDVDLAVIANERWDGGTRTIDAVKARLGNDCDLITFTPAEFTRLALEGEPVVADIMRDAVALIGAMPRVDKGVA